MAQGDFTKEEVVETEKAFTEVFKALPKGKRWDFLGHANDIYLFFAAAKKAISDNYSERSLEVLSNSPLSSPTAGLLCSKMCSERSI